VVVDPVDGPAVSAFLQMGFLRLLKVLLTPEQKRRLLLLQGYFAFSAVLQVAGVASLAPFIALIANPRLIQETSIAKRLYDAGGFSSDRDFIIAFAVVLMIIITSTNAVLAGGVMLSTRYAKRLGVDLQREILRGYLHRDYERISRTNTAKLVATFTQGVPRLVYMVVQPALQLNSSVLVALLILAGLVWFDPISAMLAGAVTAAAYVGVYALSKGPLKRSGAEAWEAAKLRYRLLTEALGGLKEIRLAAAESKYEGRIDAVSRSAIGAETLSVMLGELPRYALESIVFCSLLGLGILLLVRGSEPQDIVGVLSLYAMAGYRLLPAAQGIFRSLSQIRANAKIVHELLPQVLDGRRIVVTAPADRSLFAGPPQDIQFSDVWYTYPEVAEPTIRGVTFRIPRHSITAFVGASGAGKSTVADLLLGLLRPARGSVTVGGTDIHRSASAWQQHVGYVPQSIFLLDQSIKENVVFGSSESPDHVRLERAAVLARVADFARDLPGQYDYVVGERGALLSGGQRQRVGLARALYREAKLLVLDEATSALDSVAERHIVDALTALKPTHTIVMIAHRPTTILGADHVVVFDNGTVVDVGTPQELLQRCAAFRDIMAIPSEHAA
jgi:HlyD family secretion protein